MCERLRTLSISHFLWFNTMYANTLSRRLELCETKQSLRKSFTSPLGPLFKVGFNKHNCPKINIFNSHRKKNIGWKMYFYLIIEISFYLNIVCELGLSQFLYIHFRRIFFANLLLPKKVQTQTVNRKKAAQNTFYSCL